MLSTPVSVTRVATGDDRRLDVREWGDPAGMPVFFLHGTPGGSLLRHVDVESGEDVYAERHLRVITYARPGYGGSTPRPGRRAVDDVEDIAAVADALGVRRFGVAAVSGGSASASALAAGARIPERAVRVAVFVGAVPFRAPGLDFLDGMDDESRQWYLGVAGPDSESVLERDAQEAMAWVRDGLPGLTLGPGLHGMIEAAFEDGLSLGTAGIRDDSLALVGDWGFDVGEVAVPVRLLYADDDSSIPPAHARWLRDHLRDAELRWVAGDHFGSGAERGRIERELELLAWAAPDSD